MQSSTMRSILPAHIQSAARKAAGAAALVLALASAPQVGAQALSVARWKNDAAGAYTVTMDDFCADHITGIQNHADTMFFNRGLPMAFGAIAKECDENDFKTAERMIGHGHEWMNHTWSHACGEAGLDWCKPYWGPDEYGLEIDKAGQVAEDRLGIKVRFFIFPYDVWEQPKLAYLQKKGYLGARSGIKGGLTPGDFRDGFNLGFDVNWPRSDAKRWELQKYTLNGYIDEAIAKGGWAIRETHGVNDSSWGYLLPGELREHLDYAKARSDLGLLWVSGPSDVIKYARQRDACVTSVQKDPERVVVYFADAGLDTAIFNSALTFTLSIPAGFPSGFKVYQQGKPIAFFRKENGDIRFNAHPHRGSVVVTANPLLAVGMVGARTGPLPRLASSAAGRRAYFRLEGGAGPYQLDLFSPSGRLIRTLGRGLLPAGTHSLELPASALPAGLYVLGFRQGGARESLRILIAP